MCTSWNICKQSAKLRASWIFVSCLMWETHLSLNLTIGVFIACFRVSWKTLLLLVHLSIYVQILKDWGEDISHWTCTNLPFSVPVPNFFFPKIFSFLSLFLTSMSQLSQQKGRLTAFTSPFCLFFCRFTAGHLLWTRLLVFHILLRAEPARWGDVPCLSALDDRGWLHWPFQFGTLLPRLAVKCESQCGGGTHQTTHR